MIYILTTICFFLGAMYLCLQKISSLRKKFPMFEAKKIISTFFGEEWDTMFLSFICYITLELAIFITIYNKVKLPPWAFNWVVYVIALVWGWGGTRLCYKWLGTAEDVLDKKATAFIGSEKQAKDEGRNTVG